MAIRIIQISAASTGGVYALSYDGRIFLGRPLKFSGERGAQTWEWKELPKIEVPNESGGPTDTGTAVPS